MTQGSQSLFGRIPQDLRPSPFLRSSRVAALEAIRRHIADFGAVPSYAELGHRIGVLAQRVGAILRDLEADGYVALESGRPRRIKLQRAGLSVYATSELLLELQARGQMVRLQPATGLLPSVWEAPRTECEVTIPAELNDIP